MRKYIPVVLSIAILSCVSMMGCEDNTEPACKTEGYVSCNDTCIDPMASNQFCGANEYCEGYVACKDTETCFNGRCRPTNCEPDEHYHDVVCEKDSVDHCGEHGVKCADQVEGWKSGTCVDKSCKLEACNAGFHIFENTCEPDDVNHCGSHDKDCSKEISGWADGACEDGACHVSECQPEFHLYNNACEADDVDNCGAHGTSCSLAVNGWADGDCIQATCTVKTCAEGMQVNENACECQPDFHLYNNACEADDVGNCGAHGTSCSLAVNGWASGDCIQAACSVYTCIEGMQVHENACECQPDYHEYNNGCEADDVDNCGAHGTSCSLTVNGWASGDCLQTTCVVKSCAESMHVYNNACELDDVDNCGLHGRACASTVAGWKAGACTKGTCKLLQCIDGYHVDDKTGECVQDTTQCCGAACTTCKNGQVCGGGQCRDSCPANTQFCNDACIDVQNSVEHCGECGHNCNNDKPDNAKAMLCTAGACTINECTDEYHVEKQDDKQICEADTINACGKDAFDCTSNDWWESGSCTNGACIPNACKGDYHPAKNDLDQNWCEPDSAQNCGEHGLACSGGQQCASGRCLGNTTCNGVLRNTLTDLDHCGGCNHRCDDGLICDRGTCKLGNGQAYCSGKKVTMGTIDRCSGCNDRCADSLLCKDNACVAGAGMTHCSDITPNTLSDVDHCGSCNNKCGNGLICSEGKCQSGNGIMYCSGIKIDSTNDSAHCSGCGNKCPAGSKCIKTSNIVACSDGIGKTYCSGVLLDTSNDSANCGQCGKKCGVGQICKSGSCQTGTGATYCDGKLISTSDDSANCGQCSNACTTHKRCQNGACSELKVGETIIFGEYDQNSIEWYILDKDAANYRVMLVSMDVLDWVPYNTKRVDVTWARSTIRSWLNGYGKSQNDQNEDYTSTNFISTAFTDEELTRIPSVQIVTASNPEYGTSGGPKTTDKVFLLSVDEVETLLGTTKEDICAKISCKGNWWLRTRGKDVYTAAFFYVYDERIAVKGIEMDYENGVRPALWLNY